MPGKHVSEAQRREFWALISNGIAPTTAAERVGASRSWGWRQVKGVAPTKSLADRERLDEAQPEPKSWDQLDGGVKDCLSFDGGFSLFSEVFLLRRPTPWREDAARRVVEALEDRSRRSYIVANEPPGSGKSTLFTCDIPLWLIVGGGIQDPIRGRALRAMLGSFAMTTAVHYTSRLKRLLESPRPFFDKEAQRKAELSLVQAFGRFKPRQVGTPWTAAEFIVEQFEDIDLTEKEPTVQAASREKGFLGERVDFYSWDDLVNSSNVRAVEVRETLAEWFADESETRLEPGGVGLLVGQRLGPADLYRNRLDVAYFDADGLKRQKYEHIVYPAHHEATCDAASGGEHRQWDGKVDGCLLDAYRLPWAELDAERQSNPRKYRLVFQQEDVDPAGALIDEAWLRGGEDHEGFVAPGSYDKERGFHEWPAKVNRLVDYVTVDPAAGNWWAMEWWAVQPETRHNYLIEGRRGKLAAGAFLDWDNERQEFSGWMHETQVKSYELGHPIRVWIIEANAAHRYLEQFEHFHRWRNAFPNVFIIAHATQRNKIDTEYGVEGLMRNRYRTGMKHLPKKPGPEPLNYLAVKEKELTTYPFASTDDTVMADWMGEWNLNRIISLGRHELGDEKRVDDVLMPGYLRRRTFEMAMD